MPKVTLGAQYIPKPSYDLVELVHANRKPLTMYISTNCWRFTAATLAAKRERALRGRVEG